MHKLMGNVNCIEVYSCDKIR